MSRDRMTDGWSRSEVAGIADGPGVEGTSLMEPDGRPHLRVKIIERIAIVRFVDFEIRFEESDVRSIGEELDRLIEESGHARLLLNFAGVRYLSSDVLGKLAWLAKQVEPVRGRIQLCGLDPLLRDMLRITHLDRV